MKLKKGFVLRQVADTWVVLAVGEAIADFNCMLTLNEVGAKLWLQLDKGCTNEQIAEQLCGEYEVSYEQALADVEEFVAKLVKVGCAE